MTRILTNFGNFLPEEDEDGEAALLCFDRALAKRQTFVPALIGKAAALQRLGRPGEALVVLDALVGAGGAAIVQAETMRGNSLLALERLGEAGRVFDRVLAAQPDHTRALVGRGLVALQRGSLRPCFTEAGLFRLARG